LRSVPGPVASTLSCSPAAATPGRTTGSVGHAPVTDSPGRRRSRALHRLGDSTVGPGEATTRRWREEGGGSAREPTRHRRRRGVTFALLRADGTTEAWRVCPAADSQEWRRR
jgi:hypothetical protein